MLSTIAEEEEDSDLDTRFVDSSQKDLDVISREPHEFTHPNPAYQVLASQTNLEAEQTLGLVHSEQSLRNAKANMASALTGNDIESESERDDFTDASTDEEGVAEDEAWINAPYFPTEQVLDEFKSQARKAMKEPMIEDPMHKKLTSSVLNSIKLKKMNYISLHTSIKSVQQEVETLKTSQTNLFDKRLPALTMLNLEKKLKEESALAQRIEKLETRVDNMEGTLKAILEESIHQSKILKGLLEAQTSNPDDNKKREKNESSSKFQPQPTQQYRQVATGPSNPNAEDVVKLPNRKRMSTQTQRHQERKKQKLSAEERRREREATMILEKQDQERKLVDFKASTKEITEAAKAGNLKEVIEKSKKPGSSSVTEKEREGKDEATLRLIERIRKETEEEEKMKTDVK